MGDCHATNIFVATQDLTKTCCVIIYATFVFSARPLELPACVATFALPSYMNLLFMGPGPTITQSSPSPITLIDSGTATRVGSVYGVL